MTTSKELREVALRRGASRGAKVVYAVITRAIRSTMNPWLRIKTCNTEVLDLPGATVLAPSHRSHLDSALVAINSKRRIRALGKESLFRTPVVSYICAALGAIPVKRGQADRDAMVAALELLKAGESMIVFPEGARESGSQIKEIFDGPLWLASRAGARVVPIGVSGTEEALGSGAKWLRRSYVGIVVGDPIELPEGRLSRQDISSHTELLRLAMQKCFDEAAALHPGRP